MMRSRYIDIIMAARGRARALALCTPACSPVDDSPSPWPGANDLTAHSLFTLSMAIFVVCLIFATSEHL